MAGITLAQAEAQLATWLAAAAAVAESQEYEIDTGGPGRRRLRRADAGEIRNMISFWDAQVKSLTPGGSSRRIRYVVPE